MSRKTLLLASACLVVLLAAPAANATIVDDINPQGKVVHVTVANSATTPDKGWVEVTVDLGGGKTAVEYAPYEVGGQSSMVVTTAFTSKVIIVINAQISESPDPVND